MSNIIFNSDCNRNCVYCFSAARKEEPKRMTLDNLTIICDFLERSRKRKINVLGGEPTLHPQFNTFLKYLISRRFTVHLFSNGIIADEPLENLRQLVAARQLNRRHLKFVINVNEEQYRSPKEKELQNRTFQQLHQFISLSFNIYQKENDLDFLVDLIDEYKLIGEIRLGLASPIAGKQNRFLALEDYPAIAQKITRFSDKCQANNIDLVLDCGFPLCMFTDEAIGRLYKNKAQIKFICNPIPDIDPHLNVFHCYPLSGYFPQKLDQFKDLREVHRYFHALVNQEDRKPGIYESCRECAYRERGMCQGGCKGHFFAATQSQT